MRHIAIILLAGKGVRFAEDKPKQFALLNDKPIAYYAIKSFQDALLIDSIVLVSQKDDAKYLSTLVQQFNFNKVKYIVVGGETRQKSVDSALNFLNGKIAESDIVYIHDGARPFVSESMINSLDEALINENAAIPVLPCDDTMIVSKDGKNAGNIIDRKEAWRVQTPQAFKFKIIVDAHHNAIEEDVTDDAQLVRKLGVPVKMIIGDKAAMKLTTKDDLIALKSYLEVKNNG